ncbi:MAG TPA: AMP-binding protein [Blastocatellia bacterium]|jgi:acetyl-CoA synthetase|nr:AMP-binding protein [Blastocatellia bacterium]
MIDPTPHLERFGSYEQACREFRWRVPGQFNIARAISNRHKDAVTRIAVSDVRPGGVNTYTFGGIDFLSDKFANLLARSGVRRGDAVAIILPQSAASLVAQFGALKLGAVAVPVSPSLPTSTMRLALGACNARAIVADHTALDRMSEVVTSELLFAVGAGGPDDLSSNDRKDFWREVNYSSSDFTPVVTSSGSPAFIFFHSDAEGGLTGVVHSHRSLIGQLTAFEMYTGFSSGSGAAFWTAGDWATPQTLLGVVGPALWYGCSIVASDPLSFGGEEFFASMEQLEVNHAFVPSPELYRLKQAEEVWRARYDLKLRSILTTPGAFTQELYDWASDSLGATLNVLYGSPETGVISTTCEKWFAGKGGTAGRASPGRSVEVIDEVGNVTPAGRRGRVALSRFDPGLFLGYLNDSEKADARFAGDWFVTGEAGYKKEDGDLYLSPSPSEFGR